MPRTERVFFVANVIWSALALSAMLHNQLFAEVRLLHVSVIHAATAGVTLMAAMILWARYLPAVGILRILIYAVMLAQGALIIYSIESIFTWPGFATSAFCFTFIFYMFGFRIYLTSPEAQLYFAAE